MRLAVECLQLRDRLRCRGLKLRPCLRPVSVEVINTMFENEKRLATKSRRKEMLGRKP